MSTLLPCVLGARLIAAQSRRLDNHGPRQAVERTQEEAYGEAYGTLAISCIVFLHRALCFCIGLPVIAQEKGGSSVAGVVRRPA